MPLPEKLKRKLLTPEKLKLKLLTPSRTGMETDRGNTICLFHHSSNGGSINIINLLSAELAQSMVKANSVKHQRTENR